MFALLLLSAEELKRRSKRTATYIVSARMLGETKPGSTYEMFNQKVHVRFLLIEGATKSQIEKYFKNKKKKKHNC